VVQAGYATFRPPRLPGLDAALRVPELHEEGAFVPGYFLVRFARPVTDDDGAWLDARTAPVRRADASPLARWALPDDTRIAWVADRATGLALEASPRTDWVGRYQPGYKLEPALADAAPAELLRLDVDLIPGHPADRVIAGLEALGARVLEEVVHRGGNEHDLHFLAVETSAARLPEVARIEGVRLVQARGELDPIGNELPRALDGRWVAFLAARAAGGLPITGTLRGGQERRGYDQLSAFLDLLAYDHPDACITVGIPDPASLEQSPLKNALVLEPALLGFPRAESAFVEAANQALGGIAPSSALRKALWLDAVPEALEAAPAGPRAVRTPEDRRWIVRDARRDAPAVETLAFRCTGGEEALRVTLAWTDEPGSAGPGKKLLTDLDLVVTAPDGTLLRGNRFGGPAGASVPDPRPDARLETECVRVPRPAAGLWTVAVHRTRGAAVGHALVVSGPVREPGGRSTLSTPTTVALEAVAGTNSVRGPLSAAAMERFRVSDDLRYSILDQETLTLTFEPSLPAGASVSAVRFFVEHHEEPRIATGDIEWRLEQGSSVLTSLGPPLRYGNAAEGLDLWEPSQLPSDPGHLALQIANANAFNSTVLDRAWLELDYVIGDTAPSIVSVPNPSATVGFPYAYDADGRAEAVGTGTITWSVVSGPAGLAIGAATGLVTWTPSATGSFAVTLQAANPFGTATQAFTVGVEPSAPLPSTVLPTNPAPIPYCPPERLAFAAAKSQQKLNVFLPLGPTPPGGWPLVVNNRAGGGLAAAALGSIADTGGTAPLHDFLQSGIAVVDFGVTGIGNGQGLFYPPGHASGRYESFRPADDNPEKDAEWAVQWVKSQSAYPLDVDRMCLRGSSQGAILALWCSMGPERARATGSSQVRTSTRCTGVLALQPPSSIWAMDQSTAINSRMVEHLEQEANPGVPCSAFGQAAESMQKAASVMGFSFKTAAARAHNEEAPLCLLFAEPVSMNGSQPADLSLGTDGYPRLHDVIGQPYIHDSWSGYVLFRRLLDLSARAARFHGDHSVFGVRNTTALPAPFAWHTTTFSGDVFGTQARAIAHAWVQATLHAVPEPGAVQPGH